MAKYFVDTAGGNDSDTGLTMDDPFETLEHALSVATSPGDWVFWRRGSSAQVESPSGDVATTAAGEPNNPVRVMAWPRAATAIGSADWTNGSDHVVNITGSINLLWNSALGRQVQGPDGNVYTIQWTNAADEIRLTTPYRGATVTGGSGAATVLADSYYGHAEIAAIDDSSWTVKKAAWDADAQYLPEMNFGDAAYGFTVNGTHIHVECLRFADSTDSNAIFYVNNGRGILVRGCHFTQNTTTNPAGRLVWIKGAVVERCVSIGNGTGSSQDGFFMDMATLVDCAAFRCGGYGLNVYNSFNRLFNVVLGVPGSSSGLGYYNSNDDIRSVRGIVSGRGVRLRGSYGDVDLSNAAGPDTAVRIEDYGHVTGAWKAWTPQGVLTKVDVVAGSGDPEARAGGNSSVVEVQHDVPAASTALNGEATDHVFATPIFEHFLRLEAATAKTVRYYVQVEDAAGLASGELWLEVEYVKNGLLVREEFTGALSGRSGADDWTQYVEATVTASEACAGRFRVKSNYYSATDKVYIDPLPAVS